MSDVPKMCFPNKTNCPPNGWWIIWDDGEKIEGGDWDDLVAVCYKHIVSKGLVPPVDLARQVEYKLCDRISPSLLCHPCQRVQQTIGFMEIVRWVRAMYNFAINKKFELVPQEEAERRARICAACPHQISTSGCWGCKGIAGLLPAIAGARKTEYDLQLKACGVCGCYNAVSVHIPLEVQQDTSLKFPDFCWKATSAAQSE